MVSYQIPFYSNWPKFNIMDKELRVLATFKFCNKKKTSVYNNILKKFNILKIIKCNLFWSDGQGSNRYWPECQLINCPQKLVRPKKIPGPRAQMALKSDFNTRCTKYIRKQCKASKKSRWPLFISAQGLKWPLEI